MLGCIGSLKQFRLWLLLLEYSRSSHYPHRRAWCARPPRTSPIPRVACSLETPDLLRGRFPRIVRCLAVDENAGLPDLTNPDPVPGRSHTATLRGAGPERTKRETTSTIFAEAEMPRIQNWELMVG